MSAEPQPQHRALQSTVAPFEALIQNSSDMFSVIDACGIVLYASPSVERLTGFRADEYIGQPGSDWIHPEDRTRVYRAVTASMRSPRRVMRIEARFRCHDGRWIDLDTFATNLLHDPSVGGIVLNSRDISDRKRAGAQIREAEERYRILVEQMPAVTYVATDGDDNEVLFFSPQSVDVFGYTPQEIIERSAMWLDDIHPDDRELVWRNHVDTNASGDRYDLEYRYRTPNHGYRWVRDIANVVDGNRRTGRRWQGIVIDITEQKATEHRMRDLQLRFQTLVEQLPLAIYTAANDARHSPIYMSPQFETMFGLSAEAWQQDASVMRSRVHPDDREQAVAAFAHAAATGDPYQVEYRIFSCDGRTVWVRDEAVLVGNAEDGERYWQGFLLDISEKKLTEEHLIHQAFHDALTGLPNRALLMDRIAQALARGQRSGSTVALLFIDLDNFKVVNDSLGHDAGDQLLGAVGQRLVACVRPGDTVARLGGDEFTILLEDVKNDLEAIQAARRVSEVFEAPMTLDEHQIQITASIGIATAEEGNAFASDLVRNADIAMYDAKRKGRARYQAFSPAMVTRAHERLDIELDLRRALGENELKVLYQPILDLESRQIASVEALVRWQHPNRGLILPDAFISLAEETGQIVEIGDWVLREACRQVRAWDAVYGDEQLAVSVNLSPRQFLLPSFVEQVNDILDETGLAANRLKLEITEGVIMDDGPTTIATLTELRKLGVQIAIDDFGTGYSSLAYLKRYPVDTLKIDRGFIHRLGEDREDTAIVDAVITFATSLGLRVIAEGIETLQQLDYLRARHCHEGQGYLFARPIPSADLLDLLRSQPAKLR